MTTTIPDADADAIIALWTSVDLTISLHSADPGIDGSNEIVGLGYARQSLASALAWATATDDPTTGGRLQNNAAKIDFGTAGSDWSTVTHFGFWQGATWRGGAKLREAVVIASGNTVSFPIGNLDMVGAGAA